MSRGGRRRRSRRKAVQAGPQGVAQDKVAQPRKQAKVRTRPEAGASHPSDSVMEQMRTHSRRLSTLPRDELDLDELISNLQAEYGVPATPQEYRLLIRTPSADSEGSADQATGTEAETDGGGSADASAPGTISRRRRRRRSGSEQPAATGETDPGADTGEGEADETGPTGTDG